MKIIGQVSPILLYLLISLSTFAETMYFVALPKIADQLNADGGIAQLSTTAYYIGFAVGVFSLGTISDFLGRRPIILFGIFFNIISIFLITLSTNIEFLIALRFLQAYGASVGSVIAQAMARDSYKGRELSYIYASVGMIMSIISSLGSAVGGYIIEHYKEWQYVFIFLLFYSGILLLIYIKFLPETNPYIGQAKNNKFHRVLKTALKDKVLISYALMVGIYNGLCFGFYIQAPFIFIDKMKMLPSDYGKLFFILSIANFLGGLICRMLIKRFISTYKIKILGLSLSAIGGVLLLVASFLITDNSGIAFMATVIFIPMAIHLMGHAFIVPMLLRNALKDYHKATGAAGSIFGLLYYLITATVSFLISTFHSNLINNFAYLFIVLISCCGMLFYLMSGWRKNNKT